MIIEDRSNPVDYRLEKYAAMGFDHLQSLILADTKDEHGVPLYWGDVRKLLDKVGLIRAYAILA